MNNTNTTLSPLLVLSWNCNGLTHKITEFKTFINTHPHIDIFLLQEVRNSKLKLNIPNFKFYHTPRRNTSAGGTAILIKSHIPHHHIPSTLYDNLEYTNISVNLNNCNFNILSIYCPPTRHLPVDQLTTLFNSHNRFLAAGDFNSKSRNWNNFGTDRRGRSLHTLLTHLTLSLHAPQTPTRISARPNQRDSIIDLGISKNFPNNISVNVLNNLNSDHLPVLFNIDFLPLPSPPPPTAIDWKKFNKFLTDNPITYPDIHNTNDIDLAVSNLNSHILNAQDQSLYSHYRNNNTFTLPRYIHNQIKQRNITRRLYQHTRDPTLKREINNLNNLIKRNILKEKQDSWNHFLTTLSTEDNSVWRIVKKLNNNHSPIPPLTKNNINAYTDQQKADLLADTYATQFSPNTYTADSEHFDNIMQTVNDFLNEPINDHPHCNQQHH